MQMCALVLPCAPSFGATSRFQGFIYKRENCLGIARSPPLQHFCGKIDSKTVLDARLCHCSCKTHRLQEKNQKCPPEAVLMSRYLLSKMSGLVCVFQGPSSKQLVFKAALPFSTYCWKFVQIVRNC